MYVITGVTGHTGKVAAEALLARGEKVRVVVRDAAKGAAWAARGAEVALADLLDTAALTTALTGAKGAYLLLPPNVVVDDYRSHQAAVAASIAQAVAAARVPHVVMLSSIGGDRAEGTGPIAGLHALEERLGAIAGTDVTALRAGYFMENLAGSLGGLAHGVLPTFFPADFPVSMVATQDVGAMVAALLVEGGRGRTVVELFGPGTSMESVADAIGRVTGKRPTVAAQPVETMGQALQGFGLKAQLAALYQEMTAAFVAGRIKPMPAGTPGVRHVVPPTPVDTVLRALLGA